MLEELKYLISILVSVVLGFAIGYERKLRFKEAGIRTHTIVCVGDYENDIPMLRRANIGYAVANALDSVKSTADRVTAANTDDAIAHIISELNP